MHFNSYKSLNNQYTRSSLYGQHNCDLNFVMKSSRKQSRPLLGLPTWTFPLFLSSRKRPLRPHKTGTMSLLNDFKIFWLRWLNTVLGRSAVTCMTAHIRQTNMAAKKAMVHRRRFLKIYSLKCCDIWQNFNSYHIFNENFKMEVELTNFVTHLIITVQLYYW